MPQFDLFADFEQLALDPDDLFLRGYVFVQRFVSDHLPHSISPNFQISHGDLMASLILHDFNVF